jgi:hypothetical protein
MRAPLFAEHDRHPVERQQPTHLADERVERLVELEGRAQRAGAPVRRLEHVRAVPESVPELLGLGRATLGNRGLAPQAVDEPADDQRHQHLDADLQRDVIEAVLVWDDPATA